MKNHEDDPRITAYALGELPEAERAEVEAILEGDEGARALVEELRATVGELESQLSREPALALTGEQRAAIESAASGPVAVAPRLRILPSAVGTALAAGLLAIVYVGTRPVEPERHASRPGATANEFDPAARTDAGGVLVDDQAVIEPLENGSYTLRVESSGVSTAPPLTIGSGNAMVHAPGVDAPGTPLQTATPIQITGNGSIVRGFNGGKEGLPVGGVTADPRGNLSVFFYSANEGLDPADFALGSGVEFLVGPADEIPAILVPGSEAYEDAGEMGFRRTTQHPFSTIGVDVDTASYSNARRFLTRNQLPPAEAIRVEEMLNYFRYDYAGPQDGRPFGVDIEVAGCPWAPQNRLVRVGLRTAQIPFEQLPPTNLVFLIDVSGSMKADNKLPLVKLGLELLVERLREEDSVAIVTYASESRLVLESTSGMDKDAIRAAIDGLNADGSTNGGAGIELAYQQAVAGFAEGGANRVILCSDGDFNVGITDRDQLEGLITGKATSGVYLTVLGFGMGNLKDATLEQLADKGNGSYAYIDSFSECKKVFREDLGANLVAVAKDAKVQVEFNPAQVSAWRQVGYENRVMAAQDFRNDTVDAGEIGAGHCVTALYEIVPAGADLSSAAGVPRRYDSEVAQPEPEVVVPDEVSGELCTVALRWKDPATDEVSEDSVHVVDALTPLMDASGETRFAVAVAAFGLKLRRSETVSGMRTADILDLALAGLDFDPNSHRAEFLDLVRAAQSQGLR